MITYMNGVFYVPIKFNNSKCSFVPLPVRHRIKETWISWLLFMNRIFFIRQSIVHASKDQYMCYATWFCDFFFVWMLSSLFYNNYVVKMALYCWYVIIRLGLGIFKSNMVNINIVQKLF